jgi:hypothetical protein
MARDGASWSTTAVGFGKPRGIKKFAKRQNLLDALGHVIPIPTLSGEVKD